MNATSPAETNAIPGLSEITPARTILVVDDSDDDIRLLELMFRRSRILNPLQSVCSVRDAIAYLSGEGIYADRRIYPLPALLFVDLRLGDGSKASLFPKNLAAPALTFFVGFGRNVLRPLWRLSSCPALMSKRSNKRTIWEPIPFS